MKLLLCLLFSSVAFGGMPHYERLNWDGIDVVWIENNRLPKYQVSVYFADGALSDHSKRYGETELTFQMLTSGTRRFNQKEIKENLEFYGAGLRGEVVHEYTTLSMGGLVKDMVPTLKQACHLVKDATFPKDELRKIKSLKINGLKNMINSHSAIADRAFRKLSLKGTPVENPTEGTVKSIRRIKSKHLVKKLSYFREKVKKRIYLSGPKEVLKAKDILLKECGFKVESSTFERSVGEIAKNKSKEIYLITVPKANQAQVRIGRVLNRSEISNPPLLMFMSKFLGGGFTGQLMKSIRVKHGLSYSVSAFAAGQKFYGRSGIMTFTKNETVPKLLEVVKETISDVENKKFAQEEFEYSRGYLVGNFPFAFERNSSFMNYIIQLDHQGRSLEEFFKLPKKLKRINKSEVAEKAGEVFDMDNQVIVILGSKSLKKGLGQFGKVKEIDYRDFL